MANKTDLVNTVAKEAGITKKNARAVVDSIVNYVTDTLKKGEKVTIPSFGTFSVGIKATRVGRNPATGEKLEIPEKKVVKFRAGKIRERLAVARDVQQDIEIARVQREAILSMETVRFSPGPSGREHDEVLYGTAIHQGGRGT